MLRLASALVLLLAPAGAGARCLAYEPAVVTLVGELTARTLPGPPSYRSIARGDYPESVLFLRLEHAICVAADPSSPRNSKSHSGLAELQVVVAKDAARALVGKRVRTTGTLFAAQSGHHRTPVVLRVSAIRGG